MTCKCIPRPVARETHSNACQWANRVPAHTIELHANRGITVTALLTGANEQLDMSDDETHITVSGTAEALLRLGDRIRACIIEAVR